MPRGSRRPVLVAAAAATTTAAVLGISLAFLRPAADAPAAAPTPGDPARLIPAADRRPLPRISGETLHALPGRLSLAALRGRPVYIGVWASWCIPCRKEAPMIARLARKHGRAIRFVGIDTQDSRRNGRSFVREFGLDFPHLFDPKGKLALELGVYGIPTMFLVDRRGRIAAELVGKQSEARLDRYLRLLAADGTSSS